MKFKYYRYYGSSSSIYDLNAKGIAPLGDFDAVVFNNALYLVYTYGASKDVTLSKCTAGTCTTSGWYDFGGAVYRRSLGFSAEPGVGAEVASGVNGATPSGTSYLYIASADPSPNYNIKVNQIGTNEVRRSYEYIPSYYPSAKTTKAIGIAARLAAFPSAGKYLMLAWKNNTDSNVYKAVVQKFDDAGQSDWITRSDDAYLTTNYGVRLMKGNILTEDLRLGFTDTAYQFKSVSLYGRY